MERVDRILAHPLFKENLAKIEAAEMDRKFCGHNMVHFLDVARIGRIMNLEENFQVDLELVYAAALLHDIGKHLQYTDGIPHEQASGEIAPAILRECGFEEEETETVVTAILSHRDKSVKEMRDLRGLLYRADKASRACYACKVQEECNWKNDKKSLKVMY